MAEVRSILGRLRSFLAFNAYVSDPEFPQDSKYVFSFLMQCLELPKNASQNMMPYPFDIKYYKSAKNRYIWHASEIALKGLSSAFPAARYL